MILVYSGKFYWTEQDRDAGMHGPFNTRSEAVRDMKIYLQNMS